MIAVLRPYPGYKESGLPWLGKVPMHLETRGLRHACEMLASPAAGVYRDERTMDESSAGITALGSETEGVLGEILEECLL